MRKQRLGKMKIRQGEEEEEEGCGKGRREEADRDKGEERREVGDEQGED